jgi:hypothetical protein
MRLISTKYCLGWAILTTTAAAVVMHYQLLEHSPNMSAIMLGLALYGIQGLIVEALGVKVDQRGLTFPRRLLRNFPFIVLWRQCVSSKDIDRIGYLPRNTIRVFRRSSGRPEITFSNRDQRSIFIKKSRNLYPSATIFRDS